MQWKFVALFAVLMVSLNFAESLHNLKTGSMPCFQNDSYIETIETHYSDLKLKDVICYRISDAKIERLKYYSQYSPIAKNHYEFFSQQYNNFMCHRIVYIGSKGIIAKSDITQAIVPFWVEPNEYKGKVINKRCYA